MVLEDYDFEAKYCSRCSHCKWIPLYKVNGLKFAQVCPSIVQYNFHSYSGGGREAIAYSLLEERSEITDEVMNIIYRCQLCGACQISCHLTQKAPEPLEVARELKTRCVEEGKLLPEHMVMIEGMREEDNPFGEPKSERGDWAEGLDLKNLNEEEADILFHAGCRLSYDEDLRNVVRGWAELLTEADIDFGIYGKEEACCGIRAFDTGFKGEIEKYAEDMASRIKSSGAEKLVTPCADCYSAFKYMYSMIEKPLDIEVLHITELVNDLMKNGSPKPREEVPLTITYHDPCHLGRLGEPYEPWDGEWVKELGFIETEPPKPVRTGTKGVYNPPREILQQIPKLELVEMTRTREYSWCCGAGGGVKEVEEDFALSTAQERIKEAKSTGAEALVTACPWCERNFKDATEEYGESFEVYDIVEILRNDFQEG